jgi:hypothetical protein
VPLIEIKVVKQTKSLVEGRVRSRNIGRESGAKQGHEADNTGKGRPPY